MCILLKELFSLEQDFTPDYDKQRRGLEMIINNPQYGHIFLLKRNYEVLGMVNLLITISTSEGAKVLLLEDFIIKKEARDRGYGKYLMDYVKKFAINNGFARITLLVDNNNKPARKFYITQGFIPSNMDCFRYFSLKITN